MIRNKNVWMGQERNTVSRSAHVDAERLDKRRLNNSCLVTNIWGWFFEGLGACVQTRGFDKWQSFLCLILPPTSSCSFFFIQHKHCFASEYTSGAPYWGHWIISLTKRPKGVGWRCLGPQKAPERGTWKKKKVAGNHFPTMFPLTHTSADWPALSTVICEIRGEILWVKDVQRK